MVENMYVLERLGRERVDDLLQAAEQYRLERAAAEASRPAAPKELLTWIPGGSRPVPKRA